MERKDAVFPQYYRVQCGAGEHLEVPLPVPTERRRCLSHPVFRHANPRGCTPVSDRAGSRSTYAAGRPWSMEHDTPLARRYRHSVLHRHLLRRPLLQRHHHLVLLLPVQLAGGALTLGEVPGSGRHAGTGVREKFRDCLFLVQDDAGRCLVDRNRPEPQVVDRPLSVAQLGGGLLHRDEGDTVVGEGAGAGLAHMYTPKIEKLLEPTVWLDAATQVFYSFGLAFGSLIAFGSYNTPDNHCVRDVILVSGCNAFTAVYASVVIFAILGFKATTKVDKCLASNKDLLLEVGLIQHENISMDEYKNVVNSLNETAYNITLETCSLSKELDNAAEGTGLAFIVFTQAIVELPGAPFWSCIFFLMLLALGLGSQIGILEGMLCVIFDIDLFKRIKKQYITGVVCTVCFFVGLIFCTGAGEYWLKMFDSFAGTIGLVMVALMEMISVVFIYGHEKFTKDIEEMTGYKPGLYWQVTWRFLAPIIMVCILVSSIVSMIIKKPTYSAWDPVLAKFVILDYPSWVLAIAVVIICAGIAPIPIVFLLRRFQCVKLDVDIHQGSIRRIDTTVSTKEMMGDVDMDEYHDRLEDFPEEDEDINSDDDNNSAPPITKIVPNKLQGKSFKMEVIDF
ncbi:sodium-dependent neutral amino acid transporter B(0)AT2 isoform X3 [Andrena cerasifolii]|uniref:sodium-dependent neutral amino acid transporter B(0)AT2 isoform X3 n=1 Tax=Andrena cerasifolii TaxID=2819439 RepID=UPI004037C4CE